MRLAFGFVVLLTALMLPPAATAQAAPYCSSGQNPEFHFGFAELKLHLGSVMGQPLECEHGEPSSADTLQQTTTGLAFYRSHSNTPSFTDGYRHWALTTRGLLYWEGRGPDPPAGAAVVGRLDGGAQPASASLDRAASRGESGWAVVEGVTGPETLMVRAGTDEPFRVVHLGIIGPSNQQATWRTQATEVHRQLLPAGTRIWLERPDSLAEPTSSSVYRHVLRDPGSEPRSNAATIAGELLRAGVAWVYPQAMHDLTNVYGDRQAEAVLTGAGLWAQTTSTTIYRPSREQWGGFPIDPSLAPILRALESDEAGRDLMRLVNQFPVEIGVSPQPNTNTIGSFQWRHYSIQLAPEIMSAAPASVAAVVLHELTHTRQMIEQFTQGTVLTCFEQELQAFEAQALYWERLHGARGMERPAHWLDRLLNGLLREYRNNSLEDRVRASYKEQCAA